MGIAARDSPAVWITASAPAMAAASEAGSVQSHWRNPNRSSVRTSCSDVRTSCSAAAALVSERPQMVTWIGTALARSRCVAHAVPIRPVPPSTTSRGTALVSSKITGIIGWWRPR